MEELVIHTNRPLYPALENFWRGKRVVITGVTGFKGPWLALLLKRLGAEVFGFGLAPIGVPNIFDSVRLQSHCTAEIFDIRDRALVHDFFNSIRPDWVFHMAAQAQVLESHNEPWITMQVNFSGTLTALECALKANPLVGNVVVTTDKVYLPSQRSEKGHSELDPLGGFDPYSASKAALELALNGLSNTLLREGHRGLIVVRAGNVIGGGDWSTFRLLPDVIRAWRDKKPLVLRNPKATRPWQHVLDALFAYIKLPMAIPAGTSTTSLNIGPNSHSSSVFEIIKFIKTLPEFHDIDIVNSQETLNLESQDLVLDTTLARERFDIQPLWNREELIKKTLAWYVDFYKGVDPTSLTLGQIDQYLGEVAQ